MCCSLHICIWVHIHLPHRSTRWKRSKLGETVKRHCCSSTGKSNSVAGPSIAHPRCMQTANGPPGGPDRAGLLGQVGEESLSQWGPRAVLCPWEKVGVLQLHIFTNECLNWITVHVKADHGLVKSQKSLRPPTGGSHHDKQFSVEVSLTPFLDWSAAQQIVGWWHCTEAPSQLLAGLSAVSLGNQCK